MKGMLLADVLNNVFDMLSMPMVIVALVLAAFGIAFAGLATRVCRFVRRTDDIVHNDNIVITMKIIGLVLLLISLAMIIVAFVL